MTNGSGSPSVDGSGDTRQSEQLQPSLGAETGPAYALPPGLRVVGKSLRGRPLQAPRQQSEWESEPERLKEEEAAARNRGDLNGARAAGRKFRALVALRNAPVLRAFLRASASRIR